MYICTFVYRSFSYQALICNCSYYRIHLFHLNSLDDAVRIVKETQSIEGAKLVAKYVRISKPLFLIV